MSSLIIIVLLYTAIEVGSILYDVKQVWFGQVPDIIDNAYVIVEFDNGSRGILDLCMFAEGSKNEQEICVVGDIGKVRFHPK